MGILHVNHRAAAKVDTQRDAMPEHDGKQSSHAENQREGQEVPLFPEEIDVCIFKEFHAAYDPFKSRRWSLVVLSFGCVGLLKSANDCRPTTNDCPRYSTPRRAVCGLKPNQ